MVTIRQHSQIHTSVINDVNEINNKHSNVYIGTGAYIGPGVKFLCKDIYIGDYTKIHDNTLICGDKNFKIGHNCWVGGGCILDTRGGLTIGNGVGIGAGSQLWSHIQFGDLLQGCRYRKTKPMVIEDDVWFVGHCLVSPIHAHKRSMALLGSCVIKDMDENGVYAGSPARRTGMSQFNVPWSDEDKWQTQHDMFEKYWVERCYNEPDRKDFNPIARTYIKRNTLAQHNFMKWAIPLYKYNPIEDEVLL